jgi:hypothetical protein
VLCGVDASAQDALAPGTRVLLHAHNAYPERGRWADRLDRALATGLPLVVEQDLAWYRDPATGRGRSVISHEPTASGDEPSLERYFFDRVRPLVEQAVRENRRETWPVLILHLDFKTNEAEHHAAVWETLGHYESWLTTAVRTASVDDIAPLQVGPMLVLTEHPDEQERMFHDRVPVGGRLRLFGSVHTLPGPTPAPRTNYRRWWNHSWAVVEEGGQERAGEWTRADEARLREIVDAGHRAGLWVRFYTLNGHAPQDTSNGWTRSYNFGSLDAARTRWGAAIRAGVDFVAVDQYEEFARTLRARTPVTLRGALTHADYERLFEREFDVPAGTTRIDIDLRYDDRDRTVLDLGVRGPDGFRGWSGGGRQRIFLAEHTSAFGYTPGPIAPGAWAVVLGVPNIRDGVTTSYEVTISFSTEGEYWPVLAQEARWYAGDLHAHSGHSDGRTAAADGARLRVPPQHVFEAARRAGLDFVALTDHNTASHWADVDRLQPLYPRLLLLHGREVTTYRGHFNTFGEHAFTDFRLGPARAVRDVAAAIRSTGALVSINHPTAPDDERCMGCGWNDRDADTLQTLDAVEIVNGDAGEGPLAGWTFWADALNQGHRLVAIGGSDEHTPDETADRRLGRPTTVVYADELSERGLIDGLRRGRVYVRTRGVEGPALDFTASAGGAHARMGDVVAPAPALTLQVAAEHAAGQHVSWVRRGVVVSTSTIGPDGRASLTMEARPGDWFSVVLRDAAGPTVFGNPIWVDVPGAAQPAP